MPLGLIFWIVMLIWLVFGIWQVWPDWKAGGPNAILFILLLLLGWKVFGAPVQ